MNNEEIYDIDENTDSEEIVSDETGSENVSINDVSEVENVPEKIILDDEDLEQDVDLVPELVPDPSQQEQSLEELLKQYFSKTTIDSEVDTENIEGVEITEGDMILGTGSSELAESSIDYTSLLEDILQSSSDTYDTVTDFYTMATDYDINNQLNSDVDDISLTNMLILTLIIVMMFNGVLDFARRIF